MHKNLSHWMRQIVKFLFVFNICDEFVVGWIIFEMNWFGMSKLRWIHLKPVFFTLPLKLLIQLHVSRLIHVLTTGMTDQEHYSNETPHGNRLAGTIQTSLYVILSHAWFIDTAEYQSPTTCYYYQYMFL